MSTERNDTPAVPPSDDVLHEMRMDRARADDDRARSASVHAHVDRLAGYLALQSPTEVRRLLLCQLRWLDLGDDVTADMGRIAACAQVLAEHELREQAL